MLFYGVFTNGYFDKKNEFCTPVRMPIRLKIYIQIKQSL